MNRILKFMRSDLYKNFWLFILMGTVTSGLLTSLSGGIISLFQDYSGGYVMILVMGLFGMGFGAFAAILGFFAMYFLGPGQSLQNFSKRSVMVGFALATLVSLISGLTLIHMRPTFWLLVFPGIPYIGSIYFFRVFALRYIRPISK